MALKQQLSQKQTQKLVLAPALQQAIKLLPLTNLELIEAIDAELSQNPVLEINEEQEKDGNKDKADEGTPEEKEEKEKSEEEKEVEDYFEEYFDNRFNTANTHEKKEAPSLESFVPDSTSLWDHLNWQANLTFFKEKEKEIALYIIGNLNRDGYLKIPVEEIAETMNASCAQVEEIRQEIMRFDPIGVGSLDLKEALLLQLEYLNLGDGITKKIIRDYFHLLEKSDYPQIAKNLGFSMEEVKNHVDLIRKLNPNPGKKYSQEKTFYIVPDIIVKKEGENYSVTLNNEGLPQLRINKFYRRMLAKAAHVDPEAHEFLKEKMKKAFWFLRSLDQRNNTVQKVARSIVNKQSDFIEKGLDHIKPLTLIELAQEIGVHESTVGRVVANKHMLTPRGVFSLKYFFHKSVSGEYGEEISTLRIKERIKKLVEKEDRDNPLSDIEIGEILAKENFKIARRTVAKYRKQLRISPSHIRKRKYLMEEVQ
jgi:RNA polymerase sigma-54 factor